MTKAASQAVAAAAPKPTRASQHHPAAAAAASSSSSVSSKSGAAVAPAASSGPIPTGLARYLKLEKLGEGNYGAVYKARDRVSNQLVALKKIKLDDEDEGVPSTALREVALLQDCVHPSIVKLEEVLLEGKQLYLVFEFLDLDLRRYLDNITAAFPPVPVASFPSPGAAARQNGGKPVPIRGLPLPLVKSYTYQLLQGVEHMHSHRHLHRDIKPQNLLINRLGAMKIADLGLARAISTPMPPVTHEVATLWYRPPEILLGSEPYSTPVDLWAVGCVLAEMISLAPTFPGDSEIDTLFKIWHACGTPNEESWPGVSQLRDWHSTFPQWPVPDDAKFCHALHIRPEHELDADGVDLLRQLLTLRPDHRISARQALQHPWFTKAKLHNLSVRAKSKLDAQAAEVASAATTRAEQRKKEKMQKQAEQRAAQRLANGAAAGADDDAADESFDEDIVPAEEDHAQQQLDHSASEHYDEDYLMDDEEEEDEHNSSAASSASD